MQHINYAKSKSYATLKREDPNFVQPNSANASQRVLQNERITISSDKRQRDEEEEEERQAKREKGDEDDEEEMEIDEDEESAHPATSTLSSGTSLYLTSSIYSRFTTFHRKPLCLLLLSNHHQDYCVQIYRKK